MKREQWRQVDGDMNPSQHGATIARFDGENIELIEIQPTREFVGDNEALEVGFPFWSREAYYTRDDCDPTINPEVAKALQSSGIEPHQWDGLSADQRTIGVASCLMGYGWSAEEGRGGWARDVLGSRRVVWWGSNGRALGWRYIADEDREFRALQREAARAARKAG